MINFSQQRVSFQKNNAIIFVSLMYIARLANNSKIILIIILFGVILFNGNFIL